MTNVMRSYFVKNVLTIIINNFHFTEMPLVWNDEKCIYFDYDEFRDIVLIYFEFDKNKISEVSMRFKNEEYIKKFITF